MMALSPTNAEPYRAAPVAETVDPREALAYMLARTPGIAEHDDAYRLAADVVRAALDLLATLRVETPVRVFVTACSPDVR
jgi:hypothetical protein